MRPFRATLLRELGAYFASPMAYVILTAFVAINGLYFWYTFVFTSEALNPYAWDEMFGLMWFLTVVVVPFATGRLWADERARGTLEALRTAPVREWQVVISKYVACVLYWAFLLAWTLAYVGIVARYSRVDVGAVAAGYVGLLLGGAAVSAVGLFISALSPNTLTAGVATFVVVFGMMLARQIGRFADQLVPDPAVAGALSSFMSELDLYNHLLPFMMGVVDLRHGAFYVGIALFFLWMTVLVTEADRWK
jgi:ABC-2 type transport system permease protein